MHSPIPITKEERPILLDTIKPAICRLGLKNDLSAAKWPKVSISTLNLADLSFFTDVSHQVTAVTVSVKRTELISQNSPNSATYMSYTA